MSLLPPTVYKVTRIYMVTLSSVMKLCRALKSAWVNKCQSPFLSHLLLTLASFLSLLFVGFQSPSSSCVFFSAFCDCQDNSKWLEEGLQSRPWNRWSQLENGVWNWGNNIWETTPRICRSDGSTCRYYPFYFVVVVPIFCFSLFSMTSKISPYPSKHHRNRLAPDPEFNTGYELYLPCVGTMSIKCTFKKVRDFLNKNVIKHTSIT